MSRKRKRRGRGGTPEAGALQADNQRTVTGQDVDHDLDHDIEIVDDVNLLGEAVLGEAVAGDASDMVVGADAVADTTPPTSAVHVVESLHESPVAVADSDRTVETLGELLQHAREAKGLSLEEVSARTRIALLTLRHLENDRFSELPAEAYVKGFLRSYGSFLSLDVSMLLRRYEKLSGHVSTPVVEIWDEVDIDRSGLKLWHPGRRTVGIGSAALVVAALAWVFWSQGAVMLGLRPAGELQQIEMQLQREARDGDTPQTSITGLDDAALQEDPEKKADSRQPAATDATPAAVPHGNAANGSTVEDTAPSVPEPPLKPAHLSGAGATTGITSGPVAQPDASVPARSVGDKPRAVADSTTTAKQAVKPQHKPDRKVDRKPDKKPVPAPSPEDAAGPPG
jgi:cytoskeleton protein RodZ